MKKFRAAILVGSLIICLGVTAYLHAQESQKAEEPAGKTIFLASKCATCHSIDSMGIAKKLATFESS